MRQIATLPGEKAERFIDHLATLKIAARLIDEPGGAGVWVCDEDRVTQAREELREFLDSPSHPRYARASSAARTLRRLEREEDESYDRAQAEADEDLEQADEPPPRPRPLTFVVMALAVLVGIATHLGENASLTRKLLISTSKPSGGVGLSEVRSGEVWRLLTPVLLHFRMTDDSQAGDELLAPMHLLFNLFLFLPLAGQVESRRGTARLALVVLATALASNLAQYYLGGTVINGLWPEPRGSYNFGGLSGVVYGLFGYVWMAGRADPESGLGVSTGTTVILVAWLLLGPLLDVNVANGAHFGGLAAGALLALATAGRGGE